MISLNFDQFYEAVKTAIDAREPFAHMRYGDGEGIVMGHTLGKVGEQRARQRWAKWLGKTNIDMNHYGHCIAESVQYCDVVGVPCKRHDKMGSDWRLAKKLVLELLQESQRVCCMDGVLELQKRDLFKELFAGQQELYLITCRNVGAQVSAAFGIPKVESFFLPPQARPYMGDVCTTEPHWPGRYNKVRPWVDSKHPEGKVFLIGAGGLGKIYCAYIKQQGGIALDIGSIFDGWAGMGTRSHLRKEMSTYKIRSAA